jgi:GNAT superfamily N-acetyltransferase
MKISIREWNRQDLFTIGFSWLEYCRKAARSDMRLKPDCESAMAQWLARRYEDPSSIGYIADQEAGLAGFLIGRIDEWESIPPVVESRRMGIIDAVYVVEQYRRQGIAGQLIRRAIQGMRDENAVAVETIYEASSDASVQTWRAAEFAPWMVHAYRML